MNILKTVKKIPGGLMIVPLLIGVLMNTFFPSFFEYFDGTFTSALWKTGANPLLAAFFFCNGATIDFRKAASPVYKGVVLTATKVLTGIGCGLLVSALFGEAGILGITPLAIIAALSNSNGGIYAALAGEFGDNTDVGAVSILTLNDGPFFTMVALGAVGYHVPINTLLGCIIPIAVGCLLGNLDKDLRDFCAPGASMLIPFFAVPLGAGLTLQSCLKAGLPGILLGVACVVITGGIGYLVYKLLRMETPALGAAIGTTAGNAAATPAAIAAVGIISEELSASATAQISAAIIVTAILCPIVVSWLNKISNKKHA